MKECLPAHEEILVHQDTTITKTSVGELGGEEEYEGCNVTSITENGEVNYRLISGVQAHDCEYNELVEVTDSIGRSLQTTPNHNIPVWRENTFQAVPANTLSGSDYFITPRRQPSGKKSSIKLNSEKLPDSVIVEQNQIRSITRSQGIPREISLDETLMEFFGFWIGDGCYDSHSVVLSGGLDTAELIENIVEPLADRFDFNYCEKQNGDIWLDRATLKYAMQSIGFVGDTYTKEIPDRRLHLNAAVL